MQDQRKKYTAGDILDDNRVDEITRLDEGYRIFRSLRSSPPYFEARKRDLFAMIRQLGLPTWFISLSAADTLWKDLHRMLGKLIDKKDYSDEELSDMDWTEKTRLVKSDPVTCVRYFDHRVHTFIHSVLKSNASPLGNIHDFFYRVEFQQRGSPHIHMVMWIENAPKFDSHTDEEVVAYIDEHVSCSNIVEHQDLVDLQRHKHNRTCKKQRNGKTVCRFSFPLPPMPKTKILRPLEKEAEQKDKDNYEKITKNLKKSKKHKTYHSKTFCYQLKYQKMIII